MPEHLYEYAVIRLAPQVEREEFINVGVILYCARPKFLQMIYQINEGRLKAFSTKLDIPEIKAYLHAFEQICLGSESCGPIGKLPPAERFRWLTATRSTVIQTSRVHPGLCSDPLKMLEQLYNELVAC